jgi:predicted RNase H-like nuclease (RuvC/YqgF family)
MDVHTFPVYICPCGYTTTKSGNAYRHKKTSGSHEVNIERREFVLKEDTNKLKSEDDIAIETEEMKKEIERLKKEREENKRLKKEIEAKDVKISRISRKLAEELLGEFDDVADADDKTKEGYELFIKSLRIP